MMLKKYCLSCLIGLLISVSSLNSSAQEWRSSKDFYVKLFGEYVDKALSDKAFEVFDKILPVINKARNKAPELIVVESKGWPWAIALPDNSVVVTKGALEVCYNDVDKSLGDIRLAMILGHELSHLAEDDYWYHDTYVSLENEESMQDKMVFRFIAQRSGLTQKDKDWYNSVRDREIRADDKGFMYAALAGYDVSRLVDDNEEDFFQYWKAQTQLEGVQTHASADERAAFIKARFMQLSSLAEAYQLGQVLVHFNYIDEAERVYRKVLDKLPAAEVYNNLGYIYLLKSGYFEQTENTDYFWLPSFMDTSPQTAILTRGRSIRKQFDEMAIEKAEGFLESAIEQRPNYYEAQLNLASIYFIQGKYDAAIALLKEYEDYQDSPEIESILALARYFSLRETIDIADITAKKLHNIYQQHPNAHHLIFNIARFYEVLGDNEKANHYWQKLVGQRLPKVYARAVARHDKHHNASVAEPLQELIKAQKGLDSWLKARLRQGELLNQNDLINGLIEKKQYKNHTEYRINGISVLKEFPYIADELPENLLSNTIPYAFGRIKLMTLPGRESNLLIYQKDEKHSIFVKQRLNIFTQ